RVVRAVGCRSSRHVTTTVGPSPLTVTTGTPAGSRTVPSPRARRSRAPSHTRRPPATWTMAGERGAAAKRDVSGARPGTVTTPTGRRSGGAAGRRSARASTTGTARVSGATAPVAAAPVEGVAAWCSVALVPMVLPRRRRSPDPAARRRPGQAPGWASAQVRARRRPGRSTAAGACGGGGSEPAEQGREVGCPGERVRGTLVAAQRDLLGELAARPGD